MNEPERDVGKKKDEPGERKSLMMEQSLARKSHKDIYWFFQISSKLK